MVNNENSVFGVENFALNHKASKREIFNKNFFIGVISLSALVLDQLLKLYVRSSFSVNETKGFLFTYVQNTGSLFGLFQGSVFPLIVLSFVALFVLGFYYPNLEDNIFIWVMFALLAAGIVGNLIDRLWLGYVVDFINLKYWPVFNFADSCICVSIVGLLWYSWKKK